MLKRIRIENFESLKFLDVNCANLNVLTGLNGSGKSSFVQFINFLMCYARKELRARLCCSCKELELPGVFEDVKYCYARENEHVKFHVDFEAKDSFVWDEGELQRGSLDRIICADKYERTDVCVETWDVHQLELQAHGVDERNSGASQILESEGDRKSKYERLWGCIRSEEAREKLMQRAFQNVWENAKIITAFRTSPNNVHIGSGRYGSMEDATKFDGLFDSEGGNTMEYLYKFGRIIKLDQANPMIYPGSELHERRCSAANEDDLGVCFMDDPLKYEFEDVDTRKFSTLAEQVDAWLGVISPGAHLNITREVIRYEEMYLATVGFGKNEYERRFRPQNVGFGISYVLPVLVAVLTARPTDIVIIENPEAYLHPRGQSEMGKLLARAAAYGVQVFVETHSDHVINGIRVSAKMGILRPSDINISFFDRHKHKVRYADGIRDEYYADVFSIKVDKNGALSNYPAGFLDEWDNLYYHLNC